MDRREVLRILGWAATAATAAPIFESLSPGEQDRVVAAVQTPVRVDDTVVDHIEGVLWRCMRQDDSLGPQSALDTVLAQRNLAYGMLSGCRERIRPRLLSAFANLSRFAGWLSFDLNDFDSGWYYYEQARTAAHEAQDTPLGALVLCHMSHLATWQQRPRVGIDHAVAAQGWAAHTGDPLLHAFSHDVAARAYALEGERASCFAALDHAQRAVDGAAALAPRHSLAYFYGQGQLEATRGHCYLNLHDAEQAATSGIRAFGLLDHSFVRNRAFTALRAGSAYLASGEIDHAARLVGQAARLAAHNGSARLIQEFRATYGHLRPWANSRAVRDLDDELVAYGLA
jgi:tetratricopeptide (TPR) repeat protein